MGDLQQQLLALHQKVEQINQLTKEKEALRQRVLQSIKAQHLENKRFNVGDRKYQYRRQKVTPGFSQQFLAKKAAEFLGDPNRARELMRFLLKEREQGAKFKETLEIR